MGNQFSFKDNKYKISCDLENSKSIISFKVKDRLNPINPDHYIHYKRYKHFQLPAQLKAKFKNVSELHEFLNKNAEIITIKETDVIIDLDGDQVKVPFENKSQQSQLFCETQNHQNDLKNHRTEQMIMHSLMKSVINPGTTSSMIQGEDEKVKNKIRKVLRKIILKNNPLTEVDLSGDSLEQLAQRLETEWERFDKRGKVVPDMTKKKTSETVNEKKDQNAEVEKLEEELVAKTEELKILQIQFKKFANEHAKTKKTAKKEAIEELLEEMSEYSSRMSLNAGEDTSSIKVQIKTKTALLNWIDNLTKELTEFKSRDKDNYVTVKKGARKFKEGEDDSQSGFSGFYQENKMGQTQRLEVEKNLSFEKSKSEVRVKKQSNN